MAGGDLSGDDTHRRPTDVRLVERPPTPAEYALLRREVGWNEVDPGGVAAGLQGALDSVCLESSDGEIVGCARIVGDDGIYFYLQDVIVRPSWQGHGLGALLMERVMAWLETHARPGAFVGLMAAEGVESFYERYGFRSRPAGRPGMFRVWGSRGG